MILALRFALTVLGAAVNAQESVDFIGITTYTMKHRDVALRHGLRAAYAKGVVVLTVAHLCACDPPCMIPEHVKAMCQRCHLRTDQKLHVQHRHRNKRLKAEQAGQLTLKV